MNNVPFPLIIPIDEEKRIFKGYIPIHNKEYFIQVHLGLKGKIIGSQKLNQLVQDRHEVIQTKLHQSTDIMSFLTEFKEILETSATTTLTNKQFHYSSERYSSIYKELTKIGFHRVHSMSDTMDEIIFQTRDKANRNHLLKVILPMDYPFVPPQVSCELPTALMTNNKSLSDLLTEHEIFVNKYQTLFDCLDNLDNHMRVIEPDQPKRNDTWRRIALGHHCSFNIELNPEYTLDDGKPTHVRFFGSLNRVQDLKKKWKLYTWNKHEPIHINLLNSFQMESSDDNNNNTDYTNTNDIECGICYSYKMENGELPEIICDNVSCNRGFHSICLYEWLRSNPTTTQSFNVLFGNCPYCNEKITIKAII